jgi:hypothetical protein
MMSSTAIGPYSEAQTKLLFDFRNSTISLLELPTKIWFGLWRLLQKKVYGIGHLGI